MGADDSHFLWLDQDENAAIGQIPPLNPPIAKQLEGLQNWIMPSSSSTAGDNFGCVKLGRKARHGDDKRKRTCLP